MTESESTASNHQTKSQWRSLILNGFFFLGVSLFFAGGLLTLPQWIYSPVPQPIQFNHSKHKQAGLACVDCHTSVFESAEAGLPPLASCMSCHETAVTESQEEEKIRTMAAAGKDLNWNAVTQLPKDVYFSHRRHAKLAQLDCLVCHGAIGDSVRPPERPAVPMRMKNCLECHRKMRAQVDCYACHR